MIAFRVINGAAEHFIGRLAEWSHATTLFLWGSALTVGFSTLDNPSFTVMRELATGRQWGIAMLVAASLRLSALLLNGTFAWSATISLSVRALSAFVFAGIWFALVVGLAVSNATAPGIFTYIVIMLGEMTLAIFTAGKAGKRMRAARGRP